MKRSDVDTFEKLIGQLQAIYDELSVLSKKSPNDAVNSFKLTIINKHIAAATKFLDMKYRPLEDFEQFDEEKLPQYSDVIFILAQYVQAFEKLRADNIEIGIGGHWYWKIEAIGGKPAESIRTTRPLRLKE